MSSKLSDFAPELLHCVFCFCSPSDLASLSRVNYTFRQAAEYLLYRYIHISFGLFTDTTPRSQAKKSLFDTLTSNPQKAALLRYLRVQLEVSSYKARKANHLAMKRIVDALRNAHGLVDLRIMLYQVSDASKGKLSEVIKSGHFQLDTLYCDCYQDLVGIIVSQKHLRLLGIYNDHFFLGYSNVSRLIKNRRIDSNSNFPGTFMLTSFEPSYNLSQLTLFPELCLPGQTFTLCRDIGTSLGRDLDKRYDIAPVDRNCTLAIYVSDFSDAKSAIICEVIEAMAQCFVDCQVFTMWVKTSAGKETVSEPWRIPGVSTSISRFKQLQRLDFYVSSDDSLRQTASDLRSFLLKEFVHAGLTLVRLCLDDYSMFAQLALDVGWDVVIMDNHGHDMWHFIHYGLP
ncbi:hypothetical protein M378DRAFT_27868 [Amanita muscaria Koide BX008]|uniref:F-box domain-containing protein n=1 Tax=Amanita muscaria (strain Koide BX008) TaxID=946122 RepID=A0A0C2WN75_AMAMK|nr:hypothetical protein M378DRAFT_27868 [Amanita muscaria Koide BX008]